MTTTTVMPLPELARERVAAGEAGAGTTWRAWVAANVGRSYRDVNRLLALVRSDDPEAAAAREREATRRRVACLRRGGTYVRPTPQRAAGAEAAVARVEEVPVGDEDGPGPVSLETLVAAYGALDGADRAAFLARIGAGAGAAAGGGGAGAGPRVDGGALTLAAVAAHARGHTASGPDAARWALIKWACEAAPDRVRAISHRV